MRARGACILAAIVLLTGCPGKGAGPGPGDPTNGGTTSPPTDAGAASSASVDAPPPTGPGDPPTPAPGPVTAAECGLLVDKVIAVGLAEQHARDPKAPQATPEQQAAIRERLLPQMEPGCAVMTRAAYACAMAAPDRAALQACE